ncbi:hypothetical protein ACFL27_04400 [candidate division CSSED10-310 bacterium]|uniref:Uncharacterized protein n=1 Tax=candidate division CSSED10-310 bacterium TaxID=2855610 RepID=A0ABV6YT98_UNCC1
MKKLFLFLLNFLLFSLLFFGLWFYIKTPYSVALARIFDFFSDLMGLPFVTKTSVNVIAIEIGTIGVKIETLALIGNMVTLMAFVMATPNMAWRKKLLLLPLTGLILFFYHLVSVLVILGAYGISREATGVALIMKLFFSVVHSFSEQIGKIVMPFAIWLLFTHKYIFGKIIPAIKTPQTEISGSGNGAFEGEQQDEPQCLDQNS